MTGAPTLPEESCRSGVRNESRSADVATPARAVAPYVVLTTSGIVPVASPMPNAAAVEMPSAVQRRIDGNPRLEMIMPATTNAE
ncbi:unannotated protein [freshwater metagenome]|uniref:Unannotated protein n=1 Tax=freshwater metagenome TaxID=449393 RepID=A0A6J6MP30_9ZZZZ